MNRKIKVIESTILSAALLTSLLPTYIYANEDASIEKTETVYTVLNEDGTVNDMIVSSWLHSDDRIKNISESLDQYNVENVKTDEKPNVKNNVYTWNSKNEDIYYQGNTDKKLPIAIKVTYQLDGKEMTSKQIHGKSGHLKMNIQVTNDVSKTVVVNGKTVTVHPSYLGMGMLKLDTEHYRNVKCQTGKIINDGTNEIIAFTSIPGLSETLRQVGLEKINNQFNISDEVIIEADVSKFDTADMMMAFTNEINLSDGLNGLSIDSITGGIDELMSASNQLLDGSNKLNQGVMKLNEESKPLTSAYPQIDKLADSTTILHNGTSSLLDGIGTYTSGVASLNQGNKQLYGISQGTNEIYGGSKTLEKGAASIQSGLEQIKMQIDGLDESTMSKLSDVLAKSKVELEGMDNLIDADKTILNNMSNVLDDLNSSMSELSKAKEIFIEACTNYNKIVESNNEIVDANNNLVDSMKNEIDTANINLQQAVSDTNAKIDAVISSLEIAKANESEEAIVLSIQQQIDSLQNSKVSASQITVDPSKFQKLETIDQSALTNVLGAIESKVSGLCDTLAQSGKTLSTLANDIDVAKSKIDEMQMLLLQANSSMPQGIDQTIMALKQGINQLYSGSQSLVTGSMALEQGLLELSKKSNEGIDQVNQASQMLVDNNEVLLNGAKQLNDGAASLEENKTSFKEMSCGLIKLQDAFDELQNGASQLYDGQSQFNQQGMSKMKDVMDLTLSEVSTLEMVLKEVDGLNKENQNFAGAPVNADCKVRFVFKTSE